MSFESNAKAESRPLVVEYDTVIGVANAEPAEVVIVTVTKVTHNEREDVNGVISASIGPSFYVRQFWYEGKLIAEING